MIFPRSVLNELDGRRAVMITGMNGAGKTLLALDLAHEYLKAGFTLCTNMNCVWNDDLPKIELDDEGNEDYSELFPRLMPNIDTVFIVDEIGPAVRTKDSVRGISLYKRKLNMILIGSCTELPHEDLLTFVIYPIGFFNPFVRLWVYETRDVDKARRRPFLQFFPKSFFGIFSTANPALDAEFILSFIDTALQAANKAFGQEGLKFRDMATKRSGMGENVGSVSQFVAGRQIYGDGKISTVTKSKT